MTGATWKRVPLLSSRLSAAISGPEGLALLTSLYRPTSRAGRLRLRAALVACSYGLAQKMSLVEVAREVLESGPHTSAALLQSSFRGRFVALQEVGAQRLVSKFSSGLDEGLARELALMQRLQQRGATFIVPLLDAPKLQGILVMRTQYVSTRGLPVSPHSAALLAGLLAVHNCDHGDLAAWNAGVRADGEIILFDWERGSLGHTPFLDLLHYLCAAGALLHAWRPGQVAAWLRDSSGPLSQYMERVTSNSDDIALALERVGGQTHLTRYATQVQRALASETKQ